MRAKYALLLKTRTLPGVMVALCLASSPLPVQASTLFAGAVLPLAAQMMAGAHCGQHAASTPPGIRLSAAYGSPALSSTSKSAAILGGQPSQLELMRIQQQGGPANAPQPTGLASDITMSPATIVNASMAGSLQPALGQPAFGGLDSANCATGAMGPAGPRGASHLTRIGRSATGPDDFLASSRVNIGRTSFDQDWARVQRGKVSRRNMIDAIGKHNGNGLAMIAQINRWTNRNIRYVEDRDLWGKADVWSSAPTTLRLRKGDCEDIAITKMQLLAAAGINRKDMILTIARDLVRNADHAMLIVRHEGQYLLLDNSTDRVLDAAFSYDYRPVLSFSEGKSWLHGY